MQKTAAAKKNLTEKSAATKDDKTRAKSSTKEEKTKQEKVEKSAKENKKSQPQKEEKKDKDPGVKRNKNPYMFYVQENREKVKKENEGVNNKELLGLLGKKWNSLSENEKKKYNDMAEKDKERYQRELESSGVSQQPYKAKKKKSAQKEESKF